MSKARSVNKVILVGNLTRNPSLRETSGGVVVATFGVATNSTWKDSDGSVQERAEFHNVVAFNKLAEICEKVLEVGMLVYLEGELRTRVKEDENGVKQYRTEIKLNDMILLSSKNRSSVSEDDSDNDRASNEEVKESKKEEEVKDEKDEDESDESENDDEFDGEELF